MARRLIPAALLALLLATVAAQPAGAGSLSGLVAPASVCPDQGDLAATAAVQVRAMVCMTNFARERSGLAALNEVPALDRAAAHKSADILRCEEFSHEACGRKFTFWMERVGYIGSGCASVGENIAWGTARLGSVRSIFSAWIRSPGHRENILSTAFSDLGVGLHSGRLEGRSGAHVWTQEFGSHRC